jgi:hypothetical protein
VTERRQDIHFVNNGKKAKWIEDYIERETGVARQ